LKAPSSFFRGYKGAIFLYDVLKPENPAITMKILGIKMDQFNPAGLSSFMDSKGDLKISYLLVLVELIYWFSGAVTIFAVNTFNDQVYIFKFDRSQNSLIFEKSISSDLFTRYKIVKNYLNLFIFCDFKHKQHCCRWPRQILRVEFCRFPERNPVKHWTGSPAPNGLSFLLWWQKSINGHRLFTWSQWFGFVKRSKVIEFYFLVVQSSISII